MSSDPLIAKTIGNYEIIERLGRGGMATVYRARQANMNRDVAIKVMSAELAEDPQFVARFEREAQTIANLQHPRILPVFNFGHEGDVFYLAMRLVEGETLHSRMQGGALSLSEAAHFVTQIAEALDYAHLHGVIHRDLKPNNILIDEYNNIYMMDFGLAKIAASSSHLTASGTVLGTPAYMAPEQWRGQNVDARTDVYALGVILYEMVVGTQPFEANDTPFSLMYHHLNEIPTSPREFRPELPEAVAQVVLTALEKEADDRFQSAGELAKQFISAVQGVDLPASPPPTVATRPVDTGARTQLEAEDQILRRIPGMPVPPHAPTIPPIPVPGEKRKNEALPMGEYEIPEGTPLPPRKPHDPSSFELPPATPPLVKHTLDWVHGKVERLTIPGFMEPVDEAAAVEPVEVKLSEKEIGSGEWKVPEDAEAIREVAELLAADEALSGVLHVRGTADWRTVRRLILAGLALSVFGSLFGSLFGLGIIGLISTVIWIYLIVLAWRTWKGKIGHYYVAFTPRRVFILPVDPDGRPHRSDINTALWDTITRFSMSEEYLWLEAAGVESVYFLGWIPQRAMGGLGRQRKWLRASKIAQVVREKGYRIKR